MIDSLRRTAFRLVHACRPSRGEDELDRELAAHRALLEDTYRQRGLSPEDAQRAATRALGGIEQTKELHRDARSFVWLHDARRDAWLMLRSLNRNRGFAAVAILTLAIAIGANTALFSTFNAVVLRPLPYRDPASLVVIAPAPLVLTPGATFTAWREHATRLSAMAGFNGPRASTLIERGTPAAVDSVDITWNFLSFLGTPPVFGRDFSESDSRNGAPRVGLLSHELWQRRFGGERSIVGRTLTIDGQPVTIVGITAPGFRFPVTGIIPATGIAENPQPGVFRVASASTSVNALGRLAPGATAAMASAELLPVYRETALKPMIQSVRDRAEVAVLPLHERLAAELRQWLLLLMGLVAIVLIVASANVANLLLARATSRGREFAVRAAVGARMGRLVRMTMTESLVLAALGAALGLLLAWWIGSAARPLLADRMPHVREIALDWTVFAFTAGVAGLTGVLCGVASLSTVRRLDIADAFKNGGGPVMSGRTRLRRLLLSAEVGFSFVLVLGALLAAQTFYNLARKDRGFDARNVLTLRLSPDPERLTRSRDLRAASAALTAYAGEVSRRLEALPGVESVGMVTTAPLMPSGPFFGDIAVDGIAPPEDRNAAGLFVTAAYFRTMRTPLVAGREFSDSDSSTSDSVAIVNQTFERHFSPDRSIVGRRIVADGKAMIVVGVTHDVAAHTFRDAIQPQVYIPLTQSARSPFFWTQLTVAIRTTGPAPARLTPGVRQAVWSLDTRAVIANVATLEDRVAAALQTERQSAIVFTAVALVALLIAVIGVYGVASYTVEQRMKELGIRVALGAARGQIVALILRHTVMPAALGIAGGIPIAIGATATLAAMLYGVTALDVPSFAAAAALLTIAALAATIAPLRRLRRLDPFAVLRTE